MTSVRTYITQGPVVRNLEWFDNPVEGLALVSKLHTAKLQKQVTGFDRMICFQYHGGGLLWSYDLRKGLKATYIRFQCYPHFSLFDQLSLLSFGQLAQPAGPSLGCIFMSWCDNAPPNLIFQFPDCAAGKSCCNCAWKKCDSTILNVCGFNIQKALQFRNWFQPKSAATFCNMEKKSYALSWY